MLTIPGHDARVIDRRLLTIDFGRCCPGPSSSPRTAYPSHRDPAVVTENTVLIIDGLVAGFVASVPVEEVHFAARYRSFRKRAEHKEPGRSFVYPREPAIYNGSPWEYRGGRR